MTCSDLETALRTAFEPAADVVYHLAAPPGLRTYVVWAEYGIMQVWGDDVTQITITRVQIDAYTQDDTPLDENVFFQAVLAVLNNLGLWFSVQDAGYDPDAAAMRLIIHCDVA